MIHLRNFGLFALAVLLYYLCFGEYGLNSDVCNAYLQAMDLVGGNFRLQHWVFASNQFLTSDVPLLAFLSKLLGFRPQLPYFVAALLWSSVVFLSLALAGPGRWLGVAALLAFPLLGPNDSLSILAISPIHIGTIAYLLVTVYALGRFYESGDNRWLALQVVALGLGALGDPLAVVMGALPFALVCLLRAAQRREGRRAWLALGGVLWAVLLSRAALMLWQHDGFRCVRLVLLFVQPEDLGRTSAIAIRGATSLVGSNFWGHSLRLYSLAWLTLNLLRLPLLFFMLAAVFRQLRREWQAASDPEAPSLDIRDSLLLAGFCVDLASVLLSSTVKGAEHIRYLLPALVYGSILMSRHFAENSLYRFYLRPVTVLSAFYLLYLSLPHLTQGRFLANREVFQVIERLQARQLHDGFCEYWDAGLMRVLSRGRIYARPLERPRPILEPYVWFVREDVFRADRFTAPRFFVLTRQRADYAGNYEQADVLRSFGTPLEQEKVGYYLINIYARPHPALERIDRRAREIYQALP